MTNTIYSDSDYENVKKQRKHYKIFIYVSLGIYLAISIVTLLYYMSLPYQSPKISNAKLIQFLVTGIYIIVLYLFLNLKYRRVNCYYKILGYINTGIIESNYGEFVCFEDTVEVKEGVDFKLMKMSEWSHKKSDFFERKVLIDREKDFPDIKKGQKVKYLTQGNILIEYEIVEGE